MGMFQTPPILRKKDFIKRLKKDKLEEKEYKKYLIAHLIKWRKELDNRKIKNK